MSYLGCAVFSRPVVSDSLRPHELQPTRILCPWGFSGQEYWSGLPCPPPGIFPTQVFCIADGFFTIWATREAKIHPKHFPACLYTVFVQAAITNYHSLYLHNGLRITYSWRWQRTEQTVEEAGQWCLGWKLLMREYLLKASLRVRPQVQTSRWPWRTSCSAFQNPGPALHTRLVQPLEGLALNASRSITTFRGLHPGLRALPATTSRSEGVPNLTSSPLFHDLF